MVDIELKQGKYGGGELLGRLIEQSVLPALVDQPEDHLVQARIVGHDEDRLGLPAALLEQLHEHGGASTHPEWITRLRRKRSSPRLRAPVPL